MCGQPASTSHSRERYTEFCASSVTANAWSHIISLGHPFGRNDLRLDLLASRAKLGPIVIVRNLNAAHRTLFAVRRADLHVGFGRAQLAVLPTRRSWWCVAIRDADGRPVPQGVRQVPVRGLLGVPRAMRVRFDGPVRCQGSAASELFGLLPRLPRRRSLH